MAAIPAATASLIASFHLASKAQTAIADNCTAPLVGAKLSDAPPLLVHDLLGQPLYYDFFAFKGEVPAGRLRVSADSDLGVALHSLEPIQAVPDLGAASNQAWSDLAGMQRVDERVDELPVCYSDHKLGLRLRYKQSGNPMTAVYDVYERRLVAWFPGDAPEVPEGGWEPDEQSEGVGVFSILQSLPEAGDPTPATATEVDATVRAMQEALGQSRSWKALSPARADEIGPEEFQAAQQYFADHPPVVSASMLPIDIVGQQTPVFCAVASANMILKYYGFNYTQDEIAQAMHPDSSGCTNPKQVAAYAALSNGRLAASYDTSPTFDEAFKVCNEYAPMKSGVPGHARVCRGWKKYTYVSPADGQVQKEEYWYLINDPWPVGQGRVRWENSSSPQYRNFIYVRRVGS